MSAPRIQSAFDVRVEAATAARERVHPSHVANADVGSHARRQPQDAEIGGQRRA